MKKNYTPFLVGIFVLVVVVLLLVLNPNKEKNITINNSYYITELEIGMTYNEIDDVENTTLVQYYSPGYECDLYAIESFEYYLINNTTAITLNNNQINRFFTWDRNYCTEDGLSVGSTLGEVLDSTYGLEYWYDFTTYNFMSMQYESAFYLYDRSSCTSYVFLASQLTIQQQNSILSTGEFEDEGRVYLSSSLLQSISSIQVSWIMKAECLQQPYSYSSHPKTPLFQAKELKGPQQAEFYIKFKDSERFTLSDGTAVSASLTTDGIGGLYLNCSWKGKTPTKLYLEIDGNYITFETGVTSGYLYSQKNGDSYSISLRTRLKIDFSEDYSIYGVRLIMYPITEEERKYGR